MTSTIKEALDGVRIIQSYNLEDYIDDKLNGQSEEYLAIRKKVHSRIEIAGPVTEFLATSIVVVVLIYTTLEVAAGHATPGSFMGFVTSLLMLNQPIKKVQENFVRIQEVIVAARRVYSITEDQRTVPETANPLPFPENWKTIEFRHISFSYGDNQVLKDINFTVARGERVAFVGESGSGKSTLINLLPRFYDPTHGEILIDGISLNQFKLHELRRHISLVSQDVFLFRDSIESNVRAGDLTKPNKDIRPAIQSANALGFVSKLKEAEKTGVGDRGALLSGGEKQRISIARAIFKDAPILVLDEATSALDSANEREVQKGLDDAMVGRTSLIVAHRLSTIQNVDRIFVMQRGSIVEIGNHAELMNKGGLYSSFVQMQKSDHGAKV
jgi:ATP-binding cassette subfamily B protein/subfamily B ATP-binding cassette protein MsbA